MEQYTEIYSTYIELLLLLLLTMIMKQLGVCFQCCASGMLAVDTGLNNCFSSLVEVHLSVCIVNFKTLYVLYLTLFSDLDLIIVILND